MSLALAVALDPSWQDTASWQDTLVTVMLIWVGIPALVGVLGLMVFLIFFRPPR